MPRGRRRARPRARRRARAASSEEPRPARASRGAPPRSRAAGARGGRASSAAACRPSSRAASARHRASWFSAASLSVGRPTLGAVGERGERRRAARFHRSLSLNAFVIASLHLLDRGLGGERRARGAWGLPCRARASAPTAASTPSTPRFASSTDACSAAVAPRCASASRCSAARTAAALPRCASRRLRRCPPSPRWRRRSRRTATRQPRRLVAAFCSAAACARWFCSSAAARALKIDNRRSRSRTLAAAPRQFARAELELARELVEPPRFRARLRFRELAPPATPFRANARRLGGVRRSRASEPCARDSRCQSQGPSGDVQAGAKTRGRMTG